MGEAPGERRVRRKGFDGAASEGDGAAAERGLSAQPGITITQTVGKYGALQQALRLSR